ncbi:MAG: hypothetical protein HWN68_04965 [Desulfobacterales bacterium]|nr:hypothetical protein [Desulfobacterales bacterium]
MKESTRQPPEKQQSLVPVSSKDLMSLPGKKALDVILESPTPVTLVQSLAAEDLFWLVHDIGPVDALPVLSLASNDQWQYLLDLELWKKDRLGIDSVNRWLDLLLKADAERFLIWGLREHRELIELNLFKSIEVRIKEEDESPSDFDEGYFTLDGLFFIRIKREEYDQIIRDFLRRLASHDINKFHQVLAELAGVLPAELEEHMYRLRNVRLAEKGFLPFEEAVGIYQYLNPQSLMQEAEAQKVIRVQQPTEPVPVSTSLLIRDQDLFYISLRRVEDGRILERLQAEFAAMCNQIISADGFVVRDKENLAAVVGKACGYLSIGLQKLAGGDDRKAAGLVQRFPLSRVFRVGYGAAMELRWDTEKWLRESWFAGQDFDTGFWEDDWGGILEGLLKRRPLFYTGFSEGEPYREFKTLEEITHCRKALDEIMGIDRLLSLVFAQSTIAPRVQAYQPVTYKNLLMTCWAQRHLGLPEEGRPLAVDELRAFFNNLWGKGARPYLVDTRMKQAFLDWLQMRSDQPAAEILGRVGKTFDRIFGELEREYGSVSSKDLDPRYIKHFFVAY